MFLDFLSVINFALIVVIGVFEFLRYKENKSNND